jgi:hypothetical protein
MAVREVMEASATPTLEMRRLFTRLFTGWRLDEGDSPSIREVQGARPALQAQVSTNCFVVALKHIEDARASVLDDVDLAIHLGRLAVQSVLEAYFSGEGLLLPGDKWPRLLRPGALARWASRPQDAQRVAGVALPLCFPSRAESAASAEAYVEQVIDFARQVRALLETDRRLAIAYGLCPQIYEL